MNNVVCEKLHDPSPRRTSPCSERKGVSVTREPTIVIPAKAGIHSEWKMDSGLRRNDGSGAKALGPGLRRGDGIGKLLAGLALLMLLALLSSGLHAATTTSTTALAPIAPIAPISQTAGIPVLTVQNAGSGQNWSLSLQVVALMTVLTLLPAVLLMMTSFTRIIIVLSFLRQALSTQSTPPNQVLLGLALFLTFFVMSPVLNRAYENGVKPYMDHQISAEAAIPAAAAPFKHFMLDQTRDADLQLFTRLAKEQPYASKDDVPFRVAMPAFVTSELKTAFQMGFLLFIPFLVIDIVVASVLMSMGMAMVSPSIISLPFKIMLFVMVDGWSLLMGTLAGSFYT